MYGSAIKFISKIKIFLLLLFLLSGCTNLNNAYINKQDNMMKENIKINISFEDNYYFTDNILIVKIYEYDQRLADVSANLIDLKKYLISNTKGNHIFSKSINIDKKLFSNENKKYYLLARVYDKDGNQTHHGYRNGTEGFIPIFKNSKDIMVILK